MADLAEMVEVAQYVNSRWGGSPRWADRMVAGFAPEFLHYPRQDVMTAVRRLFDEGLQGAPSPSMVKKTVKQVIRDRYVPSHNDDGCSRGHQWGILEYEDQKNEEGGLLREDGLRLVICVRCHTEALKTPASMVNQSEWEDGRSLSDEERALIP
jgi:hypothetical protein